MARSERGHRFNVPGARDLRTQQTPAEALLWDAIRSRRLASLKFRRQHPIGPFVADFCCPERRLIVEVDGGVHDEQRAHDAEREVLLVTAAYRVLRIRNEAIFHALPSVLVQIREAALGQRPVPPADRSRTGGW